ncbi:MAG: Rap1a/Tai family immunity protein [Halieaceae bacterium]
MLRLSRIHLTLCLAILLSIFWAVASRAIEVLTIHELVSHCAYLETDPEGADSQYCIRYIQGFIDGAVETDERILQTLEGASGSMDALTERAMRTRMPRRGAYDRPGSVAGFCLYDPLPLRQVVDTVVADLVARDIGEAADSPARDTVDDSLRRHYPCTE